MALPHPGATRIFTAGLGPRVALAGVAAAVILATAWLVDGRTAGVARETVAVTAKPGDVLHIHSTSTIATWLVRCDGRDVPPTTSDPRQWSGDLPMRGRVSIEANPVDALSTEPIALRITATLDGRKHVHLLWGEGLVSGTIDLRSEAKP